MKLSYTSNPELTEPLFDLLDTVFPGLRDAAAQLSKLGASWEAISTPWVAFENGRPISHVGVIEIPLILNGRPVTVGSVHAVATHPDHRRRGHYGRLMREVIADTAGHLDTLILTTENPEYYEPFGFRYLAEHEFTADVPLTDGPGKARVLRLGERADLDLVHRLLGTRDTLSNVVGVGAAQAVFLFNEARKTILYVDDLDVMVCAEEAGDHLHVYDVVGPRTPVFEDLRPYLPGPFGGVVFHYPPDRMHVDTVPRERVLDQDGPSYLMARGPFDTGGRPFTLPRSGRT